MPAPVWLGGNPGGGVAVYPQERLYQEMAYIAYHFHWSSDAIMHMGHQERLQWVDEIAAINTRLNETAGGVAEESLSSPGEVTFG